VQYGGFVAGAQLFDDRAFVVTSAEASAMDPQHRLLRELGYEAVHGASRRRAALMGSDGGVTLGIERPDWALAQPASVRSSVYAVTCDNVSVAAGRLSFVLGLQGPCSSVDTACSSALVAVHGAAHAVCSGESAVMLALAVSLKLAPHGAVGAAAAGMLSVDGRCKTWDATANGYARAEAVGACVLQPNWAGAQLGGSSVRQDGRSASLTAPNGSAQRVLLLAALGRASVSAAEVGRVEAHGTGTVLGDPTEAGALAEVFESPARVVALALSAAKASVGHSEAGSGQVGLLTMQRLHRDELVVGNSQLRVLNPMVGERLGSTPGRFVLSTQSIVASLSGSAGVSSFGYSGTIAHALLRGATMWIGSEVEGMAPLQYQRRVFEWREAPSDGRFDGRSVARLATTRLPLASGRGLPHPMVQNQLQTIDGGSRFQSPVAGALLALVVHHVVQSRVIFPGAGYLEMARAAWSVTAGSCEGTALRSVFFVQPLGVESSDVQVECIITAGTFEVSSGVSVTSGMLQDAEMHCKGEIGSTRAANSPRRVSHAPVHRLCARAVDFNVMYVGFHQAGLQYGPEYRTLRQVWGGCEAGIARLRARVARQGTQVHPADLDDGQCLGTVDWDSSEGQTRLPNVVDEARLHAAAGVLWAVRAAPAHLLCPAPVSPLVASTASTLNPA
jgi:acyl transferase domain-containing protein